LPRWWVFTLDAIVWSIAYCEARAGRRHRHQRPPGVMPSWENRFDPVTIKSLAVHP
jgi:hypothetical protein